MDSRAKQRLTGAVILVALFVLLVPELLTGPKNAAQAPASAEEEGLRRYTIDLNAPTAPADAPRAESAVALPPVAEAPTADDSARAQPAEQAAPQAPPQSGPAPAEAATQSRPPATTNPISPPAPAQPAGESATAASSASATRPAAASSAQTPRETRKPAASGTGRFVVQLGSFGSRDNAERLVRDMTAKGFTTFIAPITTNGRELYRVRVGPAKDRAAAEALATQLKRMGQSGSIVPIP